MMHAGYHNASWNAILAGGKIRSMTRLCVARKYDSLKCSVMLGESNQEVMHSPNHQITILKNSDAEGKEIALLQVNPHYD